MDTQADNGPKGNEKMKPFVLYLPSSAKGKVILILVILSIAIGCAPIIGFVNLNKIILGMPLMMVWGLVVMVATIIVLALARKWGVH